MDVNLMVLFEGASNLQAACHSRGLAALKGHGGKDGKVLQSNLFKANKKLTKALSPRQVAKINGAETELVEYLSAQVVFIDLCKK